MADFAQRSTLVGIWLVMFALFAVLKPGLFLSEGTMQTIFGSQTAQVFVALAALCAFVVGEFDLSVASVMGLTATIVPVLVTNDHVSVALACAIAIMCALLVGALNAFIIVKLGIDAIVTTLGMATLLGGVGSRLSNSDAVTFTSPTLEKISSNSILGLPTSFYYGLALAALFTYILSSTPLGRHIVFVGSNRSVARLAGVRVNRMRAGAYLLAALLGGVGGVLVVGEVGSFDPTTAPTYLLPALAAAFLGTAAISPGRFNPAGTMIAIYFLSTGIVGLQLLGFAGWISDVFYGATLILALIMSTYMARARLPA